MIGKGYEKRRLTEGEWQELVDEWLLTHPAGKRVLILPPDITRCYSYAGVITAYLYQKLNGRHDVFVMPAVGTHMQMTEEERSGFFPGVPAEIFLTHDWRTDNVSLGTVPAEFVARVTEGKYREPIEAAIDRRLVSGEFDTVISVGQVVPHEVVGMANYTKNLVVGLGGRDMINKSHMVSAFCNIETIMGNTDSPVRAIFDYVQKKWLDRLGITFFLTVTCENGADADLFGLYIGTERAAFEEASRLAAKVNVTRLKERAKRVVAYLAPAEFRSTWVGNKAIYRTRMAIADGGELLVLAPGVRQCGENDEVDRCIRTYGYSGTKRILEHYQNGDFEGLEMVSAHLIHGSTDGRFTITYATDPQLMSREEIEDIGFSWTDVRPLLEKYRPEERETGVYADEDGEYYFVKAPAVGLWRV